MIRRWGLWTLLWIAAHACVAQTCVPGGGVTCTPNLNLWLPPASYPNWNVPTNSNWSTVDAASANWAKLNAVSQTFTGIIVAPQYCIGTNCITTWPSGAAAISGQVTGTLPIATGGGALAAPSHISEASGLTSVSQPFVMNATPLSIPFEQPDGTTGNIYAHAVSSPATPFSVTTLPTATALTGLLGQPRVATTDSVHLLLSTGLYSAPRIESSSINASVGLTGAILDAVRGGAGDQSNASVNVFGVSILAGHSTNLPASATTTNIKGSAAFLTYQSGVVTNAMGYYSQPLIGSTSGPAGLVLPNSYGVYIDSPALANGATITNDYGIYVADPVAKNFFAGPVQSPQFCLGASCITAWPSGGGGGGIADVNVAIPSFAVPSSQCYGSSGSTTPTTFPMAGLAVGMKVSAGDTGNPSAITGWGASGGLTIRSWVSAPNQGSYIVCNATAASITGGAITFVMGAQ